MATLSVIVPATDGSPTVERCTAAIAAGSDSPEEIVVVHEPAGLGAPAARNAGVARSTGEVLVFVDSDVEVSAEAMARIRRAFETDQDLGALFGSYDDAPGAPGAVSAFRNLLHHHVHHAAPGPAGTFWTGLGAVRRGAFEEVGGFDESLDYMEDVDLGMRLAAAGHRILLDPTIQGKHLKQWSLRSMVRTDFHGRAIPWVTLLLRHRGGTGSLNLGWRHRLSALAAVAGAIALLLRKPLGVLAAAAALVALNREFYALLARKRGPAEAALGIVLHAIHHLVAVVGVPFGVLRHLRTRDERPPAGD